MLTKKRVVCFIVITVIAMLVISYTPRKKALQEIEEKGIYRANSLKDAEKVAGFPIATLKELPPGYQTNPKITVRRFKGINTLLVDQNWLHEEGGSAGFISLSLSTTPSSLGGDGVEIVDINGIAVQSWTREDGLIFALVWYDGKIDYSLAGTITDTVTEETYLGLAKSLISSQ